MTKLPMSDFMWNYYQSQGITFSDSEQATIISNSTLPESEILNALKEIAARTSDEVLKSQIHERLDAQAEHERCFTEKDSRYFFVFVPDDEDEWESCYFADLDAAIAFGRGHSKETLKYLRNRSQISFVTVMWREILTQFTWEVRQATQKTAC